jgi:hypothetical protein
LEALETAIGYWEDAELSFSREAMTGSGPLALTSRSEDRLLKQIQVLLEKAYKLQDEGETLFLHQVTLMTCKMFYSFFPLAFEHFGSGFVIYLSFVSHTYDSPSPN